MYTLNICSILVGLVWFLAFVCYEVSPWKHEKENNSTFLFLCCVLVFEFLGHLGIKFSCFSNAIAKAKYLSTSKTTKIQEIFNFLATSGSMFSSAFCSINILLYVQLGSCDTLLQDVGGGPIQVVLYSLHFRLR